MNKQFSPADILANRQKALEFLRSGKVKKLTGVYWSSDALCFCTLGAMAYVVDKTSVGYTTAAKGLGLPLMQDETTIEAGKLFDLITEKNDKTSATLPEMADFLETEVFPKFPIATK